ncbi:MAG TPA: Asp-tRNA(Asn)/Glu-tRNA(Gln) amidotransferase subunit GatB [Anaerolineaceae bacterium]|nr:Asp-tRNA(Asn)/Glu-tRNA(Gln) amidotransferase subunit GatB [Anaerolineaceae bacterium]
MKYEPVIGLEVHAELATRSKMFCGCQVVDTTLASPNSSVCPVCAGMPGTLPVLNQRAVEFGIRVALALGCQVQTTSIFARKNYFYPDLPKGYQISQYENPLAVNGNLIVDTAAGSRVIRIRRAHLEEDTGKLTHISGEGEDFSLVDLNRAGVPLLEIVSEPDMHSLEEVRAYATSLRAILRALKVNSGDMEKGVIRFEANVSLRPSGSTELGTRVEIKNLNSFKAMERAVAFELERQAVLLDRGEAVSQETLGWDEEHQCTYTQRSKEEAHDYRYFPEPDIPPLVVDPAWVEEIRRSLPELPRDRALRFQQDYQLSPAAAMLLNNEMETADYFEACAAALQRAAPRTAAIWITGEIFAHLNQTGLTLRELPLTPLNLAGLLDALEAGEINQNTAKVVLTDMLTTGKSAAEVIREKDLGQMSDSARIAALVRDVIAAYPVELTSYLAGKETLVNWFFGQVMRAAGGKASPAVLKNELENQLRQARESG